MKCNSFWWDYLLSVPLRDSSSRCTQSVWSFPNARSQEAAAESSFDFGIVVLVDSLSIPTVGARFQQQRLYKSQQADLGHICRIWLVCRSKDFCRENANLSSLEPHQLASDLARAPSVLSLHRLADSHRRQSAPERIAKKNVAYSTRLNDERLADRRHRTLILSLLLHMLSSTPVIFRLWIPQFPINKNHRSSILR